MKPYSSTFDSSKAKLTPAQRRVLVLTRDDRVLTIGGIDGRKVRRDVVYRLHRMGLLDWKAPSSHFEHSEWKLTEKAMELLND